MKKKRRQKNEKVHPTPQIPLEWMDNFQIHRIDFEEELKPKSAKTPDPAVQQLLRDADFIVAVDDQFTGADSDQGEILWGQRLSHAISHGKMEKGRQIVAVFVSMETEKLPQQAEELRTIVVALKGEVDGPFCDKCKAEILTEAGVPQFMFMHDGHYMIYDDGEQRGIILARTREMAKQYVAHVENRMGIKVVIAEIAALTKLPLHEFLDTTIEEEVANCAFVICEIKDGKVAYVRLLPPEEHRS
jgi:hypothetical protein